MAEVNCETLIFLPSIALVRIELMLRRSGNLIFGKLGDSLHVEAANLINLWRNSEIFLLLTFKVAPSVN